MRLLDTLAGIGQRFWSVNPPSSSTLAPHSSAGERWLIRFLQISVVSNAVMLLLSLFALPLLGYRATLVIMFLFILALVTLYIALQYAKRGFSIWAGIAFYSLSILAGTVGVGFIPEALPATVLTALLAMIASLPYVHVRQMRWMLPLSLLAVPIQSLFATYSYLVVEPIALPRGTVTFFATYCVALGLLFLNQYHRRLIEVHNSLEETIEQRTRELRDRELRFRAVSEMTSDYVFVIDLTSDQPYIEQLGDFLCTVSGYPREIVADSANWPSIIHPEDVLLVHSYIRQMASLAEQSVEFRIVSPQGKFRWLRVYSRTTYDPNQAQPTQIIGAIQDLTESRRYEEQIRELAFFDALTGLANRQLFNNHMNSAIVHASTNHPLCIVFMDLDRFKMINDTLGHEVGDLLLVKVGQRIEACIRQDDLLARLGGDEFAIMLTNTEPSVAYDIAQRVIQEFDRPFVINNHLLRVTASIGIAHAPEHGTTISALMRHADIAMYDAKQRGQAVKIYHAKLYSYSQERLQLEAELREAIEQNQLRLYFQPFLTMGNNTITAVEALVRWQHPQRGLLAPGSFISLAEECGLIGALDRWVLRAAFDFSRQMELAGQPLLVSINLSMQSLQDSELLSFVRECLQQSGTNPTTIMIEVTESMVMEDLEQTLAVLEQFNSLNMLVALDDFGSGHASLNRLTQLPVHILKIDRDFMHDLHSNAKTRGIMLSLIALAHNLKLAVIAEGVETAEQLKWLRSAGADYAQGYYIGHPIAQHDLPALLASTYAERYCVSASLC